MDLLQYLRLDTRQVEKYPTIVTVCGESEADRFPAFFCPWITRRQPVRDDRALAQNSAFTGNGTTGLKQCHGPKL